MFVVMSNNLAFSDKQVTKLMFYFHKLSTIKDISSVDGDGTLVCHLPATLRTRVWIQAGREMTAQIDRFLDFVSFSDFTDL